MNDQAPVQTLGAAQIAVPASSASVAHVGEGQYHEMYARSVSDPEGFWAEEARRLDWMTPPTV
ncbi:MAG: acetyl-coenzyme A synthetase N-terminal domain-containing protein, partial [Pseudomonadota bacterium]